MKSSRNRTVLIMRRARAMWNRVPAFVALWRQPLFPVALCLAAALLTACRSSRSDFPEASQILRGVLSTNSLRLQQGDVIHITFIGATNLDTTQKIPLDGLLTLPFIPKVNALGKTAQELQIELAALYEPQVKPAEINVSIVESAAVVYVIGAVLKPGKVPLTRDLTVMDAVMEAGGFDPARAKLRAVSVMRTEERERKVFRLDLKKALTGGSSDLFYVRPFDIIYVPEKTFNF